MFDLTRSLQAQHNARKEALIKQAVREILACPCEQKQWRAMAELKKLQRM